MSGGPRKPSLLFPGPELESRGDLPYLKKIQKPGLLSTLLNAAPNIVSYINTGIFPITGQEPLAELQRRAEFFEFSSILEKVHPGSIYHSHTPIFPLRLTMTFSAHWREQHLSTQLLS